LSKELPTDQTLSADEPLIPLRLAFAGTPATVSDDQSVPFQWSSCTVCPPLFATNPTAHTSLAEAAQTASRPADVSPASVGGLISFHEDPFHFSITSPDPVSSYQLPTANASLE
jgi:hypothetical protein